MSPRKHTYNKPGKSTRSLETPAVRLPSQSLGMPAGSYFLNDKSRIAKLRADQHNWYDDRQCNNDEESWRDPVLKSMVINICKNICTVRQQCLERDYQLGAEPGIKAGLTEDVRIKLYQLMDETALQTAVDAERPQA